ncbi:MAG: RluA family pseudouridine synthase [Myxococcota bacterium]
MNELSLVVLDQGRHHAVLQKPAGITVVRARGVPGPTLLDLAEQRFGRGVRPVHRLDKPTTGCCVVALSAFGQQALSDAFRRHLIDKRYLALITGAPTWEKLAIDVRLAREDLPEARKGPLARQTVDENGKRALTRVRVLARADGMALVEARPETGRMHQIRIHLAHVGHPLEGDPIYGAGERGDLFFLHAFALSFPLPDGGRSFASAPLPAAFDERLKRLGLDGSALWAAEVERFSKRKSEPGHAARTTPRRATGSAPSGGKPSTPRPRSKRRR